MTKSGKWTAEEWAQAQKLRASGSTYPMIAKELGRSPESVMFRFARMRDGQGTKLHLDAQIDVVARPTPEMFERRNYRLLAESKRDLTAALFGDPPPGFSALEQRVTVF